MCSRASVPLPWLPVTSPGAVGGGTRARVGTGEGSPTVSTKGYTLAPSFLTRLSCSFVGAPAAPTGGNTWTREKYRSLRKLRPITSMSSWP